MRFRIEKKHFWMSLGAIWLCIALAMLMCFLWWLAAFDWDPAAKPSVLSQGFFGLMWLFVGLCPVTAIVAAVTGMVLIIRTIRQRISHSADQ